MKSFSFIDWFPRRDLGAPPFVFQGVSARVFPLQASLPRLTTLIQRLFNIAPHIAVFRPALPIVNLIIVNYGRMETKALSYGWVAQNEVAFTVPLESYRYVNGRYVFLGYCVSAPFIYVDSDSSLHTGREVYGWPKTRISLRPPTDAWQQAPDVPEPTWAARTTVFRRGSGDHRHSERIFIEAQRTPTFHDTNTLIGNGFSFSRTSLGLMAQGLRLGADGLFDSFLQPLSYGGITSDLDFASKISGIQRFVMDRGDFLAVNLRQIRDSESINHCTYQAISGATMKTARINNAGSLGGAQTALGDPTGGFRILISHYDSHPLVPSLGLIESGRTEAEGVPVSVINPWMPYWVDVDLEYGPPHDFISFLKGESEWKTTLTPPSQSSQAPQKTPTNPPPEVPESLPEFRMPRGGAPAVLVGPYFFPECVSYVFPLLCRRRQLEEFCSNLTRALFAQSEGFSLQLAPHRTKSLDQHLGEEYSWVNLVLTNFFEMFAPNNPIGWWASRDATFFFPAKLCIEGEEIMTVSLAPFLFLNSGLALISKREFFGAPAQNATFAAVNDLLLEPGFHPGSRDILNLKTETAPSLFLGEQADISSLIRIVRPPREQHREPSPEAIKAAAGRLRPSRDYHVLGIKQVRNPARPNQAVYQEIAVAPLRVERILQGPFALSSDMHVLINRFPTHPIVQQLGLIPVDAAVKKSLEHFSSESATGFDAIPAIAPYWIRYERHDHNPIPVLWRSRSTQWRFGQRITDALDNSPGMDIATAIRQQTQSPEGDHR